MKIEGKEYCRHLIAYDDDCQKCSRKLMRTTYKEISFTLQSSVPSKKNAWRRGKNGQVYLPKDVQDQIDDLVILAKSERWKLDLNEIAEGNIRVDAIFEVKKQTRDLDNAFTTLLDVLQKAEIIKNDRSVRAFRVEECITTGDECVKIRIYKLSTILISVGAPTDDTL